MWVYLLKDKSETFVNFKNWKDKVVNQTGKKGEIYICIDNGLEFCNAEFYNLCNEYGISRHINVPYTLQYNGITKKNKLYFTW